MPSSVQREIGAVIEVEAAQEILVGLAVAAVLGDDEAGNDLERLGGPRERKGVDLAAGEKLLAGGGDRRRLWRRRRRGGRDRGDDWRGWRRLPRRRGSMRTGVTAAGGVSADLYRRQCLLSLRKACGEGY